MQRPDPSRTLILVAGFVGLVAGFLPWLIGLSYEWAAFSTNLFPLATWAPLLLVAAGGLTVLQLLPSVDLPDEVLGFTIDQLVLLCGLGSCMVSLGFVLFGGFGFGRGIGVYLSLVASLVVVGACLYELRATSEGGVLFTRSTPRAPGDPTGSVPAAAGTDESATGALAHATIPEHPPEAPLPPATGSMVVANAAAPVESPRAEPEPAPEPPEAEPTPEPPVETPAGPVLTDWPAPRTGP